jgi:hypothetical protein
MDGEAQAEKNKRNEEQNRRNRGAVAKCTAPHVGSGNVKIGMWRCQSKARLKAIPLTIQDSKEDIHTFSSFEKAYVDTKSFFATIYILTASL